MSLYIGAKFGKNGSVDGMVCASDRLRQIKNGNLYSRVDSDKLFYAPAVCVSLMSNLPVYVSDYVRERTKQMVEEFDNTKDADNFMVKFMGTLTTSNALIKTDEKDGVLPPLEWKYGMLGFVGLHVNGNYEMYVEFGDPVLVRELEESGKVTMKKIGSIFSFPDVEGSIVSLGGKSIMTPKIQGGADDAIASVTQNARNYLAMYPENYSGLEVALVTKDRAERVAYEPISA